MRKILRIAAESRRTLPFAVVATFLLVGPLALDAAFNTHRRMASRSAVESSYKVLLELEALSSGVQEARSIELLYLTDSRQETRKPTLAKFQNSVEQLVVQTDRVALLTQNDVDQQQRLYRFRHFLNQHVDALRLTVLEGRVPAVSKMFNDDEELLQQIEEMKAQEQRQLHERNAIAERYASAARSSLYLCIAVFSSILSILFLLLSLATKEQRRTHRIASDTRTALESSLTRLETETESMTLLNELQKNFQICYTAVEAYEIITKYLTRLFPEANGSLATINNSRNIMETVLSWGEDVNLKAQAFAPEDCCALRGGRMYSYSRDSEALPCRHFAEEVPEAYICLPLVALGDTLGILHVNSPDASVLSVSRLRPLQQVVEQAAMTLANLNLRSKLREQSIRDPLTGLFNRRYLEITLEREVRRSLRKQSGVGIIMMDGDKFKQFNDTFGHDAGDVVLKELAGVLRRSVRSEDVVCRYGGEEFIIVLTDCTAANVYDKAEKMRLGVSKLQLEHAGRSLGQVTASFGVSFCQDGSLAPEVLVRFADEALYKAKKEGRDRVVMSDAIQPPADTAETSQESVLASTSPSGTPQPELSGLLN